MNAGQHRLASRGLAKLKTSLAPKIATQARVLAGVEKRAAPVSGRAFDQAADEACQKVTSCGACVGTSGCVWALAFGLVGPMENPTGFGSYGVCVVGDSNGPADRTMDTSGLELFDINIFSEGNGGSNTFWAAGGLSCDKPFRVAQIDANTLGTNSGMAMRSSVEVDSNFGRVYSVQELQAIGNEPDKDKQQAMIMDLVFSMFRGIRLYLLIVFAEGGETETRAGFGMFYFGTDLGTFMKSIFDFAEKQQAAPANSTPEEYNPFSAGGAKSVMFFVLFDSLRTYAYTAGSGLTPATTTMANLAITALTVSQSPMTSQGKVDVYNYHMAGNLGTTQTRFDMSCYMGTDEYTLHGNTVDPTSFECDFIITNIASGAANNGAAYGVGVNAVIIALDVDMLAANEARAANDNKVNVGNADFVIVATASQNSDFVTAPFNVLVNDDKNCESVTWLSADFKGALSTEFGGSASAFCVMYSFDVASPANVYWDPKGDVDETKANAAVNAQLNSSSAVAPFIAAIIAALALVLAM